jgi:hypothetical protein
MTTPSTNSTITFNFSSSSMTNKDTSPLHLITLLTSDPINYSTEITLSTTASKSSTTASKTFATTRSTTKIILQFPN